MGPPPKSRPSNSTPWNALLTIRLHRRTSRVTLRLLSLSRKPLGRGKVIHGILAVALAACPYGTWNEEVVHITAIQNRQRECGELQPNDEKKIVDRYYADFAQADRLSTRMDRALGDAGPYTIHGNLHRRRYVHPVHVEYRPGRQLCLWRTGAVERNKVILRPSRPPQQILSLRPAIKHDAVVAMRLRQAFCTPASGDPCLSGAFRSSRGGAAFAPAKAVRTNVSRRVHESKSK